MVASERVDVLYAAADVDRRIEDLAREIVTTLPEDFLLIGVLKGCFMFVADLARALDRAGATPGIEFIRLASYGLGKESSGEVQVVGDLPGDIRGRQVLVVDDIQDTGRTLAVAQRLLIQRGAAKVWSCALLDKPSRREVDFKADFIGFDIEDVFVVGYGIDYAERYRHLPYIGIVRHGGA